MNMWIGSRVSCDDQQAGGAPLNDGSSAPLMISGDKQNGEELSEEQDESDEFSSEDADAMQPVLDAVRDRLNAANVMLQPEFEEKKITKDLQGRYFLFHDGDGSTQLVQIKKVYNSSHKVFRQQGMTVVVKFWNARGKQDMALQASAYDTGLHEMKAWVFLCVDKGKADV